MRILIADDEPPARDELAYMIGQAWPTAEIHLAHSGAEAIRLAQEVQLDLAFLDINMPNGTGLEVASALATSGHRPEIVFATAYSEHAVEAFNLAALDYLVKPYDERRLRKTLDRVAQRIETNRSATDDALAGKIWGETDKEEIVLVEVGDIAYVEADRKKVFACTADGRRIRLKPTLKELSDLLGSEFLRIHKGYLVNLRFIGQVQRWYSGGYSLKLIDKPKSELQVSRRFASLFKETTRL